MEVPPGVALYASTPLTRLDRMQDVLNVCILDGFVSAHPHKNHRLSMK
jgi:hypothetical protein